MSRLPRFGSAVTAIALASVVAGCAGPWSRQSARATKIDMSDVGLATRAHAAMTAGDFAAAIHLAERAVENTPEDAIIRALLGNAYFAGGRFASAEAAYEDSLALSSNQPQVILKLALVQIAQGKTNEAIAFLNAARAALPAADYGLALALAGQPNDAVAILEPAARANGADARVRQNLALAYGLSGDWLAARTVAAQDLAPNLVDARVHQWMALAKPTHASEQVAALVGVTPASSDPGQPVQIALKGRESRLAQFVEAMPATPVAAPQPMEQAALPPMAAYEPVLAAPEMQAEPQSAASPIAAAFEAPVAEEVLADPVAVPAIAEPEAPAPLLAALAPTVQPKPKLRTATKREGNAGFVVQLGAYSSRGRVETAWQKFAGEYNRLQEYTPTTASFDSSKGTVYRLSVKGFASVGEANGLCSLLRSKGKTCFVRPIAGDAAVQFASR